MQKLTITLYNRDYVVSCDPGQEVRLREVARIVETEMNAVADRVGNSTEPRHLMLTCLSLADKLLEARGEARTRMSEEEEVLVAAVDHLRERVAMLASQVGRA